MLSRKISCVATALLLAACNSLYPPLLYRPGDLVASVLDHQHGMVIGVCWPNPDVMRMGYTVRFAGSQSYTDTHFSRPDGPRDQEPFMAVCMMEEEITLVSRGPRWATSPNH